MKDTNKFAEVKVVLEEFAVFNWSVNWVDLSDQIHYREFESHAFAKEYYDSLENWKYRSILRIKR